MFKKLVIAILACAFSNVVSADGANGVPFVGAGLTTQFSDNYTGLMANWFGGYGAAFQNGYFFYFGGEIFGEYPSIPVSGHQNTRIIYDLGANLTGGIYLNQYWLLYTKLGVQTSRLKMNDYFQTGGLAGIGIETSLTPEFDVRGEFIYVGQGIFHEFFRKRNNDLKLALVYKIN